MHYDQSWMGYGWVGALEAGAIALLVGAAALGVFHWRTRGRWSHAAQIGWAWLVAMLLAGSGDLWDLFYFNYARLQSVQLLRVKLAAVHDPDGLGTRVLCEMAGAALGVGLAWAVARTREERPAERTHPGD